MPQSTWNLLMKSSGGGSQKYSNDSRDVSRRLRRLNKPQRYISYLPSLHRDTNSSLTRYVIEGQEKHNQQTIKVYKPTELKQRFYKNCTKAPEDLTEEEITVVKQQFG